MTWNHPLSNPQVPGSIPGAPSNGTNPAESTEEFGNIGLSNHQLSPEVINLDTIKQDSRPQIWKCLICGQLRQWGFGPNTSDPTAILFCHTCRKPTRHTYDNWVPDCSQETRKKRFPNIDFGCEE